MPLADRQFPLLLILPAAFLAAGLYFRAAAGPFWQWHLLDPAYFYLLDALNVMAGETPGHPYHPGITVSAFGALVLRLRDLGTPGADIAAAALARPEAYLASLSTVYLALNAVLLVGLGVAARRAFDAVTPALACQLAPFLSSIVLKHAFLPKPEAMLVATTLVLMTVAVAALRTDRPVRLAVAFGVIAGFGVATKVTAAPIFALPLFVIAGWRPRAIYVAAAAAAFVAFFLPGIEALPKFAAWVAHVGQGAGDFGAGPQTIIDAATYPDAVAKMLKRPALRVPLALTALALAVHAWRRRRGGQPSREARLLAGVGAAQVLQVLLVAKQPAAFYLIPAYMLSALSVTLAVRLLWTMKPATWRPPVTGPALGAAAVCVFAVVQGVSVARLDGHFQETRTAALGVDNARFERCARIYIYAASSPVYALFLADMVTGDRHAAALAKLHPGAEFWIDDWWDQGRPVLRDWSGPRDFAEVRAAHPCLYLRGTRKTVLAPYLRSVAPDLAYRTDCAAGAETVLTVNVSCSGEVTP